MREHLDLGRAPRLRVREQVYEGKRQRLKSKSGRRDLPLSPGLADRLRAHRRDHFTEEKKPVFTTPTGEGLRRSNVANRVLSPAVKAAGLVVDRDGEEVPWVTFHTFRHTCASLLFENGRNLKQVSEWLGHADPSFTLSTYIHLLDDGIGGAEFFDEALGGKPALHQEVVGSIPTAGFAAASRPTVARPRFSGDARGSSTPASPWVGTARSDRC